MVSKNSKEVLCEHLCDGNQYESRKKKNMVELSEDICNNIYFSINWSLNVNSCLRLF